MPRINKFESYLQLYRDYVAKHRIVPSFRVAKSLLQVSSLSTIHRFYQQLVSNGYLLYQDGKYHMTSILTSYDYFESVQAGFPSPATDELKSQLDLHSYLIPNPLATILVKVVGDSMINAGIHPNDVIVVEKGAASQQGDMVVAVVDGDYTVKYLARNTTGFYLKAANPNYPDIIPSDNLEIFGLVVGSFRKY